MPDHTLPELIAQLARPLPEIEDPAFAAAFDDYADCRVVLLGEASHGTHEFYAARAAITRRFVERHGFTIVAAEADWPDAAAFDRQIRERPELDGAPRPFRRFPRWMWRNPVIEGLLHDLREINRTRPQEHKAGFYGLDLYNMSASIEAVLNFLDREEPDAAELARERYACLTPWQAEPSDYGRLAQRKDHAACEAAVVAQCHDLLQQALAEIDGKALFGAAMNARLIAAAEQYYRAMYRAGNESWNLRDRHMANTLTHLLDQHGPQSKAIVWAHNSHIGDARATAMGWHEDGLNLGQLVRQRWGERAALIGFGTHSGTVTAAHDWGGRPETMAVNPSLPGSYERLFHDAGLPRLLLSLRDGSTSPLRQALRERLVEPRLERFIGVIYRPRTERQSHYIESVLPEQFDAFAWFDRTHALQHDEDGGGLEDPDAVADTFPSGL